VPALPAFGLPANASGIFLAKFRSNGALGWSRAYGGGDVNAPSVRIGPGGVIAAGATLTGSFGGASSSSNSAGAPWLFTTDADGKLRWTVSTRSLTVDQASSEDQGVARAVGFVGDRLVALGFEPDLVDNRIGAHNRKPDVFNFAIDPAGHLAWETSASLESEMGAVALDGSKRILFADSPELNGAFESRVCGGKSCIVLTTLDAGGAQMSKRVLRTVRPIDTESDPTFAFDVAGAVFGYKSLLALGYVGAPALVDFDGQLIDTTGDQAFLVALPE
jgi:hypothetical protein